MVPTRSRHRSTRPGFSLLELTLVLAIIGILMAVAAYSIFGQGEKARIRATAATMTVVKNAIQQYQLEKSAYPDTLQRLQSGTTSILDADKPIVDGWGQPLIYSPQAAAGRPYSLFSRGPNTQFENGAGDDISIWNLPKD